MLEITGSGVYSGGFAVNAGTLEVAGRGVIDNSGPLSGSGTILLPAGGSMMAQAFPGNVVLAGGTLSGGPPATPALGSVASPAARFRSPPGQTMPSATAACSSPRAATPPST